MSGHSWHHSDSVKQRIAESKRRHWSDPVYREKMLAILAEARKKNIAKGPSQKWLEWRKTRVYSAESRAKQGASLSARLASNPELKAHMFKKGRVLSEESRQKIARAHVGMRHTAEARAKMSRSKKGKSFCTPEMRAAMSARFRGRPAHYPKKRIHYKGSAFRSSWELRAAIAMDALGVRWEYEPKRFDLVSQTYCPDFYLPDDGAYWEVKGWYNAKAKRTIALFREHYPEIPLVLLTERGLMMLEQAAARKAA